MIAVKFAELTAEANLLWVLFAQNPEPPAWLMYSPYVIMIVLFYFVLIRPQQTERAQRLQLLNSLKKNDRVLTSGGIVGVVTNMRGEGSDAAFVTIRTHDDTRIDIVRSAITRILDETDDKPKDK